MFACQEAAVHCESEKRAGGWRTFWGVKKDSMRKREAMLGGERFRLWRRRGNWQGIFIHSHDEWSLF